MINLKQTISFCALQLLGARDGATPRPTSDLHEFDERTNEADE